LDPAARFGAGGGVGVGTTRGTSSHGGSGPEAVISTSVVNHVGIAVSAGRGGGRKAQGTVFRAGLSNTSISRSMHPDAVHTCHSSWGVG